MLRFIFKTLIILWPFLKNVVFKDRTVLEVLANNKHITLMMVMVLLMMLTIVSATNKLSAVNKHATSTHELLAEAKEKIVQLEQELEVVKASIKECPPPSKPMEEVYDKKWIIDSLKNGESNHVP